MFSFLQVLHFSNLNFFEANKVDWYCADITQATLPQGYFDVWHDRAVFHFLTEEAQDWMQINRRGIYSSNLLKRLL